MNKQLSIIIPCYNCAETLREAVESCYIQGFSDEEFEIVMVDDGSTDNTREVMNTLSNEHTNIYLAFHTKNRGGGATRNTAVENAKSEIIFCLDSDDILPENILSKMRTYLLNKKCDGIGLQCSTKFIANDVLNVHHIDTFSYIGEKIPFDSLFQRGGILCPLYSVFMFTKSAFKVTGGYPIDHGFDTQGLAWRFLAKGLTAYTCPNTNYFHRIEFHKSYYLREYNAGKANFNWQKIFLEHAHIFSEPAQQFISTFPCADFTREIFTELLQVKPLLQPNYRELLNTKVHQTPNLTIIKSHSVTRNSLRGLWFRARSRLLRKK